MNIQTKFLTDTRITGLLYLALAVTGIFVFVFAKSAIYVSGDALTTNAHLLEKEMLARAGIAVELVLVAFQALVAIWFYKLFSKVSSFASVTILVFGMVNAIMILVSSAMWLGALNASIAGENAVTVYSLFNLHETIWLVANLFFGLWLIPMGYLMGQVMTSKILSKLLIISGIGYVLSALTLILLPSQVTLAGIMVLPATVAEFWVVGYLLVKPQLASINN